MKRQFYLDDVERDLLRCALEFWSSEIAEGLASKAHRKCGAFTQRRISQMLERLQEVPEPAKVEAASVVRKLKP
jgi:hypothetical protein